MTRTLPDIEAIYREYQPKVTRLVRARINNPEDAKDVVSKVFLKVCDRLHTYDSSKASISTWIYQIARNQMIDFFRKRRDLPLPEGYEATAEPTLPDGADTLLDRLADALETLPERQRDVVVLYYYAGMNHQQIADRMRISYANARKLCSLGVAALRKKLTICDDEEPAMGVVGATGFFG